jgi:GT2 family glycosyltransferase
MTAEALPVARENAAEPVQAPVRAPVHAPAFEPLLSILVISYNTREMTLACLRSVVAETTVPYELIVLDNASKDGSAAAIAAEFEGRLPNFRLIASAENLGFARGNNVASEGARGKYVLLLNPDTLVLDHALDAIVAFAERTPEAGIWGGRTLSGDRSLNPTSVFGDMTLWSLFCRATGLALIFRGSAFFNSEFYGGWQRDSEREVDVVMGCFFLMRRDDWEALGGLDPIFVMYGEEADLCRRARARGARPRMTPDATIVHFHGASSLRADREIMTLKAHATMIRRHFPAWQRPVALFLLGFWPWSRMVSGGTLARLSGRLGFAEAARMWGDVWRARREWLPGYPPLA